MARLEERSVDSDKKSKGLGRHIPAYTDNTLYQLSLAGLSCDLAKGGLRILDLCCGKGMATAPFKDGNEIFYLDLSQDMIEAGREEGYIEASDERVIIGEAENILMEEKITPFVGTFDIVINRFSFHDFTTASYQLFKEDKELFYKQGLEKQGDILDKIIKLLKPNGKLQIIDTAVPSSRPSEVKHFYNKYHMLKTTGSPIGVHIPYLNELTSLAKQKGVNLVSKAWYKSSVSLDQWYREGQLSKDRFKYLRKLFVKAYSEDTLREAFSLEITTAGVKAAFPVVILTLGI